MCVSGPPCTGWSVWRGPDSEASHHPGRSPWGATPSVPGAVARVRAPGLPVECRGGRQEVCQQHHQVGALPARGRGAGEARGSRRQPGDLSDKAQARRKC